MNSVCSHCGKGLNVSPRHETDVPTTCLNCRSCNAYYADSRRELVNGRMDTVFYPKGYWQCSKHLPWPATVDDFCSAKTVDAPSDAEDAASSKKTLDNLLHKLGRSHK
jgi:hypothetical protein